MRYRIGTSFVALLVMVPLAVAVPLMALHKSADQENKERNAQFQKLQKEFQNSVEEASKKIGIGPIARRSADNRPQTEQGIHSSDRTTRRERSQGQSVGGRFVLGRRQRAA